jgi:hypothetical protein
LAEFEQRIKMKRRHLIIIAGMCLFALMGCKQSSLPLVPVSGKVSFAGGAPPAAGTITFVPVAVEAGLPQRPATAHFGPDGTFQVTSFKKDDGLLPGTYQPNVICMTGEPVENDPSSYDRLNAVPKNFVPPPVVVDASKGKVEVAIDVPAKK